MPTVTLQDILVCFLTLRDYYHTAHVSCKNSVFYSDHLLLERLYNEASEPIDSIKEKMLGIGMGTPSIHLPTLYKKVFEKIKNLPYDCKENAQYFEAACKLEEEMRQYCEAMDKDPASSVGVRTFIGDLADGSEDRCYLIGQRLAK